MKNLSVYMLKISLSLLITFSAFSCAEKEKQEAGPQEITVVNVEQKDVPIYHEFVGQVYGSSDIPIRARVSGFLEGVHFDEGRKVNKGQLLYTIDPEPFQAQVAGSESQLAEAKTGLAKAKSDLDRIEPLAKINAVSKSDLDAAVAAYDASLAYVDAMKANLHYSKINLGYCWMKSPLNGVIGKTQARIGEFVGKEPNPVILNTISTIDTVRVEFFLTESNYIKLAREYEQMINDKTISSEREKATLSLILADGSKFKYPGYVNFINREVDPQTGSLLVESVFPNPDRLLKPGQYAKVVVKMTEVEGALLIPQRCISELQGQYSVFVVNSDNIVNSIQVEVGEQIGDMQIISSGISPNDKVTIDALQKVRSGLEIIPKVIEFESKSKSQY